MVSVKHARSLTLAVMICSMPLTLYRVPIEGIPVNLERVLLLLALSLSFFELGKIKLRPSTSLPFIAIIAHGLILILNFGIFRGITNQLMFPAYAQCYLTGCVILTSFDPERYQSTIVRSFAICLLITATLSTHQIISLYLLDTKEYTPPLSFFTPDGFLSSEHTIQMNALKRIYWPLSTTHALGYLTCFLSLFFIITYFQYGNKKYILFAVIATFIGFATLSRGPLLALLSTTFVFFTTGYIKKAIRLNLKLLTSFCAIGLATTLITLSIIYSATQLGITQFERLSDTTSDGLEGHFGIRAISIALFWSSSAYNQILGYGLGSFHSLTGTSSAHMSYLTILIEQGLIGLSLFCYIVFWPIWKGTKHIINKGTTDVGKVAILPLSLFIALAHAFYNLSNSSIIWLFSALLLLLCDRGLPLGSHGPANQTISTSARCP